MLFKTLLLPSLQIVSIYEIVEEFEIEFKQPNLENQVRQELEQIRALIHSRNNMKSELVALSELKRRPASDLCRATKRQGFKSVLYLLIFIRSVHLGLYKLFYLILFMFCVQLK